MFSWLKKKTGPPSPAEVVKRAIILKQLMVKAMAVSVRDHLLTGPENSAEKQQAALKEVVREHLAQQVQRHREAGLWSEMDAAERGFIEAGSEAISRQALIDTSWLAESVVCLLWALSYVSELPAYDHESDPNLTNALPIKSVADLVSTARLRESAAMEKQRDLAERWHWRARTRQLQESGKMPSALPQGLTIEQVIEMTCSKAAEAG